MNAPWVAPAALLPGYRRQVLAARALIESGLEATRAARIALRGLDTVRISSGKVDLDSVEKAQATALRVDKLLQRSVSRLEGSPDRALLPALSRGRSQALSRIRDAHSDARKAAAALEIAPKLLGGQEPRQYIVAFANQSELRGTGGFFGFFATLETNQGSIKLSGTGRPTSGLPAPATQPIQFPGWFKAAYERYASTSEWSNINISTDFPTVGSAIVQGVRSPLGPMDGVIQIDPTGLASVLKATGPVSVAPWPATISSENVASITQFEAYVRFADDNRARIDFLDRVIRSVFDKLVESQVTFSPQLLADLGRAVAGGHVQVFAQRSEEQDKLDLAGATRNVSRANSATDVIGLVSINGSGNKMDWFLRRKLNYEVDVDAARGTSTGTLRATLSNGAPASGLPPAVIGSVLGIPNGVNRQLILLLASPDAKLRSLEVAGRPVSATINAEEDLTAYHRANVRIAPGGSTEIEASLAGQKLIGSGRKRIYRFHLLRQPMVAPDDVSVEIRIPKGWETSELTRFEGPVDQDLILEVPLKQKLGAWFWERVFSRPFRIAGRFIGDLFS